MRPNDPAEREYVLGTNAREIDRLYLQHNAWRGHVFRAWSEAGFGPGQILLDLGCGPGAATLDLAELTGPTGRVIGVDQSDVFLRELQTRASARSIHHIETHRADVTQWASPGAVDGIWCRWILSFVPEPARLLTSMRGWCRPGARIAIHEYYDYGAWRLHPPSTELEEFVSVVMRSWRDAGGEPDLGLELPRLLEASGFRILRRRPVAQLFTPQDDGWEWLASYVSSGLVRLQELGYLESGRAAEIAAAFREAEDREGTIMVAPAVLELIAEAA
jgi:SAM-dependent methyltransferase